MPGAPCHLLFGFITGTGLHIVLDSNFTPPFILIFGISNFLGPDLGTWYVVLDFENETRDPHATRTGEIGS